ncbi:hypothetical protein ACFRKD_31655 [Streptomyces niveus]|uniref:hypothetical protein n=1 Tax=Streptomyces niveus TaxID=193462 RepID=UPI00364DB136
MKSSEHGPWTRLLGGEFGAVEEVVLRLKELLFPSVADIKALSTDVKVLVMPQMWKGRAVRGDPARSPCWQGDARVERQYNVS